MAAHRCGGARPWRPRRVPSGAAGPRPPAPVLPPAAAGMPAIGQTGAAPAQAPQCCSAAAPPAAPAAPAGPNPGALARGQPVAAPPAAEAWTPVRLGCLQGLQDGCRRPPRQHRAAGAAAGRPGETRLRPPAGLPPPWRAAWRLGWEAACALPPPLPREQHPQRVPVGIFPLAGRRVLLLTARLCWPVGPQRNGPGWMGWHRGLCGRWPAR